MVDLPEELEKSEQLAAELVLGLLEGGDLATAMRLRLSDQDFRRDVDAWEKRLAPLLDMIPPHAAPDHIWPKITERLDIRSSELPGENISTISFRTRLNRWRVGALATGAIAASLALALVIRPDPVAPGNPVQQLPSAQIIAQLSGEQAGLSVATRFDPETGELNVSTAGLDSAKGAPVLWVVPADGTPRAVGILPTNGTGSIHVDPAVRSFVQAGSLLALTMEDPAGAPFEAPTTPILATATISKI